MGINYCGQKTRIQLISRQGQNSQNASLNYQMDMYFETEGVISFLSFWYRQQHK